MLKWNFIIKNPSPPDQYKKKVINLIKNDKNINMLPTAFSFLLTGNDRIKKRTAEALHLFLSDISEKKLVQLDKLFRERSSIEWDQDWSKISPLDLCSPGITDAEKATILGLSTFHPNGYFREKALDELEKLETGTEIPFFLIRCNDWVPEIRAKARSLAEERLVIKNAKQLVMNLPIIYKLKSSHRADHTILFNKIIQLLSHPEAAPYLHLGTKSENNKVRYLTYDMMIKSKQFSKKTLADYFKREKDPHVRMLLFNEILNDLPEEEFNEYYETFKHDKFPRIRAEVLQKHYSYHKAQSLGELEKALLDKSGAIRSIARFLLRKQGISEFVSYYIKVIQQQANGLRGAVLGIGEVGTKEDVEKVLHFLQSENVALAKAALRSISLLDAESNKDKILNMLSHEHSGISKEARKSLQKTFYNDKIREIYQIYKTGEHPHIRYHAALLLSSLPKWESLPYIIEFHNNREDDLVGRLGKLELDRWIKTFNKTFAVPNPEQVAAIRHALVSFGSEIDEDQRREIEFCLKGF